MTRDTQNESGLSEGVTSRDMALMIAEGTIDFNSPLERYNIMFDHIEDKERVETNRAQFKSIAQEVLHIKKEGEIKEILVADNLLKRMLALDPEGISEVMVNSYRAENNLALGRMYIEKPEILANPGVREHFYMLIRSLGKQAKEGTSQGHDCKVMLEELGRVYSTASIQRQKSEDAA